MTNQEREEKIKYLSKTFGFEVPLDKMLTKLFDRPSIDVVVLNKLFTKHDPDYNCDSFVYRGEPNVSMMMYIEKKYGFEVARIFKSVM